MEPFPLSKLMVLSTESDVGDQRYLSFNLQFLECNQTWPDILRSMHLQVFQLTFATAMIYPART